MCVALVAGVFLFLHGKSPKEPATTSKSAAPVAAPAKKLCTPPWSCGQLVFSTGEKKEGMWYLQYDDVNGTTYLKIAFDPKAVCRLNGSPITCLDFTVPSGSSTNFSGQRDGDLFRISSLDITSTR
jgi:hypothetical protein